MADTGGSSCPIDDKEQKINTAREDFGALSPKNLDIDPTWTQSRIIDHGIKKGLSISDIAIVLVAANKFNDMNSALARVKRHLTNDPEGRRIKRGVIDTREFDDARQELRNKWSGSYHRAGSQADKIDEMIFSGSSMREMVDELKKDEYRVRSKQSDQSRDDKAIEGRIRNHIRHLQEDHKVTIMNVGSIYSIKLD